MEAHVTLGKRHKVVGDIGLVQQLHVPRATSQKRFGRAAVMLAALPEWILVPGEAF